MSSTEEPEGSQSSISEKDRVTLTRTSVKDKMLRLLDKIIVTTDDLRQMINRHIGTMPASNVEALGAAMGQDTAGKKTRKKREPKGPEVSVLPEAASSPLAQNVKEAIENVQEPNPELSAELKKITCPGGPAAFNLFRKRLAELFNQAGVSVTYDRMLEIAGPLYKIMCLNPIYVGTGRGGEPGKPFDPEQLTALREGLERTESLLRLSPEIMDRIAAIANGASVEELPPLTNATMSLQRQRAALGMTKRGLTKSTTRKAGKTAAAPAVVAPVQQPRLEGIFEMENENENENQAGVSMLMPVASTAATASSGTLGVRDTKKLQKLQGEINSAISSIQGLQSEMEVLGQTVPRIKTRLNKVTHSFQQQVGDLESIRKLYNAASTKTYKTKEEKEALRKMMNQTLANLGTTKKQATAYRSDLSKLRGTEARGNVTALLNEAAKTAQTTKKLLNAAKTKKVAKIQTPSGATYTPGANTAPKTKTRRKPNSQSMLSVGAVKPGPSNFMTAAPSSLAATVAAPKSLAATVAAPNSEPTLTYENSANKDKNYRKVKIFNRETGRRESYLMNREGYLYKKNAVETSTGLSEDDIVGSYNMDTKKFIFPD